MTAECDDFHPVDKCVVEVGHVPSRERRAGSDEGTWRDALTGMVVCDRHRSQYDERPDLGPYKWEPIHGW
jgi:hypothetical protein